MRIAHNEEHRDFFPSRFFWYKRVNASIGNARRLIREIWAMEVANRMKNLWRTAGQTQSRVSRAGRKLKFVELLRPRQESVNRVRRFRPERIARTVLGSLKMTCLMYIPSPLMYPYS